MQGQGLPVANSFEPTAFSVLLESRHHYRLYQKQICIKGNNSQVTGSDDTPRGLRRKRYKSALESCLITWAFI